VHRLTGSSDEIKGLDIAGLNSDAQVLPATNLATLSLGLASQAVKKGDAPHSQHRSLCR